ncbi:hypothetical protein LXL04_022534 [Taraxacum kok-saghyz]
MEDVLVTIKEQIFGINPQPQTAGTRIQKLPWHFLQSKSRFQARDEIEVNGKPITLMYALETVDARDNISVTLAKLMLTENLFFSTGKSDKLQRIKSHLRMSFIVGERIEVLGVEVGFENTYYGAHVLALYENEVVVHDETVLDDYCFALTEVVERNRIRPTPAVVHSIFHLGDDVDVWIYGGWRKGECRGLTDGGCAFRLPDMPNSRKTLLHHMVDVRRLQEWVYSNGKNRWFYKTKLRNVFSVGDAVEVAGVEEWMQIEYDIVAPEDETKIIDIVACSRVRPLSDVIDVGSYEIGDVVDVWIMGGWWAGICLGMQNNMYTVYCDYMDQEYVPVLETNIRIGRDWKYEEGNSGWVYSKV